MADLEALENWVAPLIARLQPAQRKKLARTLALALRRSQQARIARNENPDGSPFEPRKPQHRAQQGFVRRGAMFAKIRRAKYLKAIGQAGSAEVSFIGRVAQIARVHQYGLRERVSPDGAFYAYPQRQLLGFSEDDRRLIEDSLIDYLQGAF